ncbi:hypothetical protein C0992_009751 [Termitomyces sp. T32_za158]|nr:hypothetical protein C0992_009751 [Termitomyces sp. T32_za158]
MRIIYKNFDDRRQAAKLGARLARRIDGKWTGNIDVLAALQHFRDTGYIGMYRRDRYSRRDIKFNKATVSSIGLEKETQFLTAGIPYPHNAAHVPPNSVSPQAQYASEFAVAFLQVQEIVAVRNLYGWIWPLTEIIEDKTKKPMEIVRAFLDPIIKEALIKNANAPKDASKEDETESHVEEGETLIDHLVRLSSGRDTTASTLTFVIYCLAMYPAIHVRLREEVLARVGPTRRPDYDDIRDMKYLRAVINGTPGDFLRTFRQ